MGVELVFRSPEGERVITLDTRLIVGRGAECDVCIQSVRLSKQHAEFSLGRDGVSVRDLDSRNGVTVNGTRIDTALVQPDDRVVLGDVSVAVKGRGPQTAIRREASTAGATMIVRGAAAAHPPVEYPAVDAARPTAARPAPSMSTRVSFGARVMLASLAAAAIAFVATAGPITQTAAAQKRAAAVMHAATLARLLASDNAVALAAGQTLAATTRALQVEPGVRGAVVMAPDGRILAPSDRLNDTVTAIPAIGELSWVNGLQTAAHDGQVEAVAVVEAAGRRTGLVWVTYDTAYAGLGSASVGLALGAAALVALAAGFLTSLLIQRMLARRLDAFAIDVDLAVRGQLDALDNLHGVAPLARPIESINYAIERSRIPPPPPIVMAAPVPAQAPIAVPARRSASPPAAASPSPLRAVPSRPSPATSPALPGGLVLDPTFIVTSVDAGAAALLGLSVEQLVGHHVLEAIPDQTIVAALIDCLNDLDAAPEASRSLTGAGGRAIEVRATRTGPGGPITFVLQAV